MAVPEPAPGLPRAPGPAVASATLPLTVAALPLRWWAAGAALLAAFAVAALTLAWNTQQRVKTLEGELVRRLQDTGVQATEARTLSRQAEVSSREAAAKLSLLEARVAETSLQRGQLEDLIQSLARSRDENVLADLDSALRVALQQSAITGSAEPLLLTLKQADERLARYNQPRLERVRRAVAQDLDQTRSAAVADLTVLSIRLDEVMRQVDDLPLLASTPAARGFGVGAKAAAPPPAATASPPLVAASSGAPSGSAAGPAALGWVGLLQARWADLSGHLWREVKGLVRVSRIDQPEALLVAPEQAYFLRENLKLRLLNARLNLLSRQFDTAQYDLRDAQSALDRYFDRSSRRVLVASELIKQTSQQARQVAVPRPDATLAAIATAVAGR
jgi:uroporphyrin-III C-methyltransferase